MAVGRLEIDGGAICANWRALAARAGNGVETGAVVKADGYGLGAAEVATALAGQGARTFFVAVAEEGAEVRKAVGPAAEIFVFAGHQDGDAVLLDAAGLTPLLNSPQQMARHREALPGSGYGIQLDTGMNRLGLEPGDWAALKRDLPEPGPGLVMSHLACADEPGHAMNGRQLAAFRAMTDGGGHRRSLAATGGILLGPEYHFDLTRPGIGLYGGAPFIEAEPVVRLSVPVVQVRDLATGETVGYGNTWKAPAPARIATIAAGYADGVIRAGGPKMEVFAAGRSCPVVGRISMDLITVDVTHLDDVPGTLDILGPQQGIDRLAGAMGTIGYEVLTSLGVRYNRAWIPPH